MHLVNKDEYEKYLQELQKLDPKIHIELALAAAAATTAARAAMNHTNVALARLHYAQKRHELIEKGVQFDPLLKEYDIDKDGPVLSDSILPLGTRVVRFLTHSNHRISIIRTLSQNNADILSGNTFRKDCHDHIEDDTIRSW